jgi:hypothetical protein
MHRLAILGQLEDALAELLGQGVAGAELRREVRKLRLLGEPAVPEQEDGFLKRGVAGEVVDRDANVLQDALLAVDERHASFRGRDSLKTLRKRAHCQSFSAPTCFIPMARAARVLSRPTGETTIERHVVGCNAADSFREVVSGKLPTMTA